MAIRETEPRPEVDTSRSSRAGRIGLWVAQIALASLFLLAGGSKLAGAPATVTLFEAIGVGQWCRYVTGLVEVGSAIALFVPSLAVFGAVALVATMLGAIATHVFVIGGSPAVPAVLLLAALVVVWARRGQLFAALPGTAPKTTRQMTRRVDKRHGAPRT
jgi:putative oxidoreductase